jgi:hypothetical protein
MMNPPAQISSRESKQGKAKRIDDGLPPRLGEWSRGPWASLVVINWDGGEIWG